MPHTNRLFRRASSRTRRGPPKWLLRGAAGVVGAGDQRPVGEPRLPPEAISSATPSWTMPKLEGELNPPQATVVLRLVGQVRKPARKPVGDHAQELAIRADPRRCLGDGERDQLRVGDLPWGPGRGIAANGEHVSCETRVSSEAVISCSNHEVAGLEALSSFCARLLPERQTHIKPLASTRRMTGDYAPTPVEDFLDPDDPTLFPRLTPEQVDYLAEIGTQLSFARGELVFEHGQRDTPLYVILSGALDIIDQAPEGDRYFTQCREGTFAADISMFTGEPTLAAGFAAEATSLLALPPEDVRRVVATAAGLGDLLLRTMGHAPGVATGSRLGSAAPDRLTMVERGVHGAGAARTQPRSLHLARPRRRRGEQGLARRTRHRGCRLPGPGPFRQRHPASHGDLGRRGAGPPSARRRPELRRRRARRRSGRAGRCGLRLLRGSQHARGRTFAPAVRRAQARESRTTSASQPALPAPSSPGARRSRRASSAP